MSTEPRKPAEPGTSESLGLNKDDTPATHEKDSARADEKGEPFDGNFA